MDLEDEGPLRRGLAAVYLEPRLIVKDARLRSNGLRRHTAHQRRALRPRRKPPTFCLSRQQTRYAHVGAVSSGAPAAGRTRNTGAMRVDCGVRCIGG